MSTAELLADIEQRLRAEFAPTAFALVDDSAKHAGHAGAASGGGHFDVRVVSTRFAGLSRVARHRLVYASLSDLMRHAIHALAIDARTPDEFSAVATTPVVKDPAVAPGSPYPPVRP